MTTIIRTFIALAFVSVWAIPMSAQTAHRTPPNIPSAAKPRVDLGPESPSTKVCRLHCGSVTANGTRSRNSLAETTPKTDPCPAAMIVER